MQGTSQILSLISKFYEPSHKAISYSNLYRKTYNIIKQNKKWEKLMVALEE